MYLLPQSFPDNEVRKGQLTMQLKRLRETQEGLRWAPDSNELPVVSWDSCKFPPPTVNALLIAFQTRNNRPRDHSF